MLLGCSVAEARCNKVTDPAEFEDLDSLVHHPGWARVQQRFDAEWGRAGTRFVALLEKMANDTDKAQAAENMRGVIWVRNEMQGFMRGVEAHVRDLRAKKEPVVSMSRRGGL